MADEITTRRSIKWQKLLDGTEFLPARTIIRDGAPENLMVISRAHEWRGHRNGLKCMDCGFEKPFSIRAVKPCRRKGEKLTSGYLGVVVEQAFGPVKIWGSVRRRIERKSA